MGKFRYKIVDSVGRGHKGVVVAATLEEARQGLLNKSCQVIELVELDEVESGLVKLATGVETFAFRRGWAALALLVGLFTLCCLGLSWRDFQTKPPPPVPSEPISLTIKGRLDSETEDVKVFAVFPDLPLEKAVTPEGQQFEIPVRLTTVKRPHRLYLELSHQGRRWRASTRELSAADSIDLGSIEVRPPKASVPRKRKVKRAYKVAADPRAALEEAKAERMKQRERYRRGG